MKGKYRRLLVQGQTLGSSVHGRKTDETGSNDEIFGDDDDEGFFDDDEDYGEIAQNKSQAYDECTRNGPSKIGVIYDEWGTPNEHPPNCTFPFYHQGKVYYGCTNDNSYGGLYWCANDCDYSYDELFHRGVCNIPRNTRGVLGTGVGLSVLNLFVALMFTVGIFVFLGLCLVELCRRRQGKAGSRVIDGEDMPIGRSVEMTERRMQVA